MNSKSLADWVVSIQNKQLMPDPHSELGSQVNPSLVKFLYFSKCYGFLGFFPQDLVVISASESLVPLSDITALR